MQVWVELIRHFNSSLRGNRAEKSSFPQTSHRYAMHIRIIWFILRLWQANAKRNSFIAFLVCHTSVPPRKTCYLISPVSQWKMFTDLSRTIPLDVFCRCVSIWVLLPFVKWSKGQLKNDCGFLFLSWRSLKGQMKNKMKSKALDELGASVVINQWKSLINSYKTDSECSDRCGKSIKCGNDCL